MPLTERVRYLLDGAAGRRRRGARINRNSFPAPAAPETPTIIVGPKSTDAILSGVPTNSPLQTVYVRQRWADSWQEARWLVCTESAECTSPNVPTATFRWNYGWINQIGTLAFARYDKLDRERWYVKVVWSFVDHRGEADDRLTREWYGILDLDTDEPWGSVRSGDKDNPWLSSGRQTFSAFGLERLLDIIPIDKAFWFEAGSGDTKQVSRPPDFNAGGVPNRTQGTHGGTHLFEPRPGQARYWSTLDIVKYLLGRFTPAGPVYGAVTFNIRGLADLTWDRPTVQQVNQTVGGLLRELVNAGRMLSSWWRVESDVVHLHTNTLTHTPITVDQPGAPSIPANNRTVEILFEQDRFTKLVIKNSGLPVIDQAICRGGEILCVGSFAAADSTLEAAWSSAAETAYVAGASREAGYADLTKVEQYAANAEFRASPTLRNVYAAYRVPDDWDREVGDGEGGAKNPLFPKPRTTDAASDPPFDWATFAQDLPLLAGVDYSDSAIADGAINTAENTDGEQMRPLVFLRRPVQLFGADAWTLSTDYGSWSSVPPTGPDQPTAFAAAVEVVPDSHTFTVTVDGAPQWVLEGAAFASAVAFNGSANLQEWPAGDLAPRSGEMIATLAVRSGRYVEGAWPVEAPTDQDVPRTRVWDFGEDYSAVYVAPNTVVGTTATGALARSTGGWIPVVGPDDDFLKLRSIAKQLWKYYHLRRRIVDVQTAHFFDTEQLDLGDLVRYVGAEGSGHRTEVNSYVSQIVFRYPIGSGGDKPTPTCQITTWAGELTPLRPGRLQPTPPTLVEVDPRRLAEVGAIA